MTKIVNHIDHIQWVCHKENIEQNARLPESVFECRIEGPVFRDDLGFILYVGWESGLEIIAPMVGVTEFNQQFHDHLAQHGEGVQSSGFGVRNIEQHRERILAAGFGASEIFGDDPRSPWAGKIELKEFIASRKAMGTQLVFGEIEYREGVIAIE